MEVLTLSMDAAQQTSSAQEGSRGLKQEGTEKRASQHFLF